jgi:DNA segregation ATPase FtsK/SpoIIIE-like protein
MYISMSSDVYCKETSEPQRRSYLREALEDNAMSSKAVLEDFGIRGEIIAVRPGPVVTL